MGRAEAQSFDAVEKPKHYNSHPSGVEAIEVCEWLSFNLGNAVKYVWRRNHKASAVEDLKKAEWYIRRELSLLERSGWLSRWWQERRARLRRSRAEVPARLFIDHEPRAFARTVVLCLVFKGDAESLRVALGAVREQLRDTAVSARKQE